MRSTTSKVSTAGLIATVAVGIIPAPLNSTMIAVALSPIREAFEISASLTTWLVSAYLIAMAVTQPVGGRLGDRYGRRRLFIGGIVYFAIASLLAMVAWDAWSLIFFRVNQAVASGLLVPNCVALLREHLPAHLRGRGYGILGGLLALATGLGPPVGGLLVASFGWQAIFAANLPIAGAALLLGLRFMPRDQPTPAISARPDTASIALLLLTLVFMTLTGTWLGNHGTDGALGASLLGTAAVVCGGLFLRRQGQTPNPLIDPQLFRAPSYAAGTAGVLLSRLVMYTTILAMPLYAQDMQGRSEIEAGLLIGVIALVMIGLTPLSGLLSDRIGRRPLAVAGALMLIIGVGMMNGMNATTPLWFLVALLSITGAGLGLMSAPTDTAAMESLHPKMAGSAAGAMATSRLMGGILGAALLGAVVSTDGLTDVGRLHLFTAFLTVAAAGTVLTSWRLHRWPPTSPAGVAEA